MNNYQERPEGMPQGPETNSYSWAAEALKQENNIATPAGRIALELSMAENATPKLSETEKGIANLVDPQKSDFYSQAEGFNDVLDSGAPAREVVVSMLDNGVEKTPNGDYVLRYNGTAHHVNASGVPTKNP